MRQRAMISPGAEVEAADGGALLDELDGECIVDKDFQNLPVALSHKKTFTASWAADDLNVAN